MNAPMNELAAQQASAAEQSRMELQAKLNGLGGLSGRKLAPEARAKKLREACEGFESIFIQKMWQEMRNAVPRSGMFSGREERFWQDMYDQELAKSMTRAGGIGLADMMYEQLSRNLVSASRGAAASAQGAIFTPSAAPLIADASAGAPGETGAAPKEAHPIYERAAPQQAAQDEAQPARTTPVAPVAPPLANAHYSPAANTAHDTQNRGRPGGDLNQSQGLLQAQAAMREAGDKLGSRAVRPARNSRRNEKADREQQERQMEQMAQAAQAASAGAISQNGMAPGSPDALRAAVDAAKNGLANAEADPGLAAINLHNLVAQTQARNAAQAAPQAARAEQTGAAAPVTRRVRRTTNIPQNTNTRNARKPGQAIRTLNVDNVGVNSRQGQGIAAYHAQRDAFAQEQQTTGQQSRAAGSAQGVIAGNGAAQAADPAAMATAANAATGGIAPLTVANQAAQTGAPAANFAIPPLRPGQNS